MSKYKTVWMLYAINPARSEGYSKSYDTEEDAADALVCAPDNWDVHYEERTYELEREEIHDCGDDE